MVASILSHSDTVEKAGTVPVKSPPDSGVYSSKQFVQMPDLYGHEHRVKVCPYKNVNALARLDVKGGNVSERKLVVYPLIK